MAILCKYTYDPLDRVSTVTPLAQAVANRFYNGEQLMTELRGDRQRTCVRAGGQLLAQQLREGDEVVTTMIAGDRNNSVMHASEAGQQSDVVYTPFGHHQAVQASAELPGFNGEQPDPLTGHYLLGNGYRAYNPVLGRFNSPDSMSPFGKGGLNAYAYCVGDPVNRVDPTGHISIGLTFLSGILFSAVGAGAIGASVGLKESDSGLSTALAAVGSVSLLVGFTGFATTIHKWRGAKFQIKGVEKKYQKKLDTAELARKKLIARYDKEVSRLQTELRRHTDGPENARVFLGNLRNADALLVDGVTFYSDRRLPGIEQFHLDYLFRDTGRGFTAFRVDAQGRLDVRNIRSRTTLSQNTYRIRRSQSDA
ncbi:RHS repeat-associated core domain-containing protein [Pseudomonas syringae]|uniref:RHS repeat-associated core domain-containing protein n=1 Tax=Pseudomonas syringae TaxID=317 RepID=UPI0013723179|nr:RHS repeat-associated core domain-containing protein [Pseudomonas syringae]MBS7470643.1 RHS repeat-associated core domain-containing protein [Pseudomonas syringae]NAO53836.1 RHS repeat-associated core domain-containing protein [Pseudomonas syringae]